MRRRSIARLLLLVSLLLAACGGGGSASGDGSLPETTATGPPVTGARPGSFDLAGSATVSAECDPGDLDLTTEGVLTIAVSDHPTAPWTVGDPSNGLGFDSGVAEALAGELGFAKDEVVWVETGDDDVLSSGPKAYDFAIAHHLIGADDDSPVAFSDPYYQLKRTLVAKPGTPAAGAAALSHLDGLVIGVVAGTNDGDYATTVGAGRTVVADTPGDALAMLDSGEAGAVIVDLAAAIDVAPVVLPDAVVGVLPRDGTEVVGLGVVLERDSALIDCVNAAIAGLEARDSIESIGEAWLEESSGFREILTDSLETVEATENEASDADFAYLIPEGTDDLIEMGVIIEIMPSDLDIVVGQVIEIVNHDDTGYAIGPFYVGAGETLRQVFKSPGEYIGECGVSATGTIVLRVTEA